MKKLHRFLVDAIPHDGMVTDERLVHQIGHVLKIVPGESFILFANGGHDVVVQLKELRKKDFIVEIGETLPKIEPGQKLIAAVAIPKGQLFELIVQKLTELGVHTIVPLLTDRTVKQSVRLDRLQTISDEALEQSGGSVRVAIHEPLSLAATLAQFPYPSIAFQTNLPEQSVLKKSDTVVMYIGPEGGWSDDDISELEAHGVQWRSLGTHVLRTETAAIVGAYELLKL